MSTRDKPARRARAPIVLNMCSLAKTSPSSAADPRAGVQGREREHARSSLPNVTHRLKPVASGYGLKPDWVGPRSAQFRKRGPGAPPAGAGYSLTTCPVRMLSSAANTMRSELIASAQWSVRSTSPRIAFRNSRCSRSQSSWWPGSSSVDLDRVGRDEARPRASSAAWWMRKRVGLGVGVVVGGRRRPRRPSPWRRSTRSPSARSCPSRRRRSRSSSAPSRPRTSRPSRRRRRCGDGRN